MVANSNDNVLIYVVNVRIHLSIMHNQYTYINVYVCVYTRLFCLWNFPGKNTRAGCHSLFQGIFPNQGSNPGLLHCRQILYYLSHEGSLFFPHYSTSTPMKTSHCFLVLG